MSRIFAQILSVILLMCSVCSVSTSTMLPCGGIAPPAAQRHEASVPYELKMIEVPYHGHNYMIPEIQGIRDDNLSMAVNETLREEFLFSVDGVVYGFEQLEAPNSLYYDLWFQSANYLCVKRTAVFCDTRITRCVTYCTVDLTTGSLMALDDLVDVHGGFVEYVQEQSCYTYPRYQLDNLQEIVDAACMSCADYMQRGNGSLSFKPTVYLENGMLWLKHNDAEDTDIRIPVMYIEDFLLVPPSAFSNLVDESSSYNRIRAGDNSFEDRYVKLQDWQAREKALYSDRNS